MLKKGSHICPSHVSAPWPANNRRKKNQGTVWNSLCHAMWWQWVTPLRFSFKMADLLPGKIPVAHSAWVYACAWAWCFCVFLFSLMFIKTSKLCIRVYRFLRKSSPKLSNSLSHWNSHTCGICTPTGCTPNSAVEPLLKYVHKSDGRISILRVCVERVYCVFHLV